MALQLEDLQARLQQMMNAEELADMGLNKKEKHAPLLRHPLTAAPGNGSTTATARQQTGAIETPPTRDVQYVTARPNGANAPPSYRNAAAPQPTPICETGSSSYTARGTTPQAQRGAGASATYTAAGVMPPAGASARSSDEKPRMAKVLFGGNGSAASQPASDLPTRAPATAGAMVLSGRRSASRGVYTYQQYLQSTGRQRLGGFDVKFTVPFDRDAVFAELHTKQRRALGMPSNSSVSLLSPGEDLGNWHSWGSVREVTMGNNTVIRYLAAQYVESSLRVAEILEQTGAMHVLHGDGKRRPQVAIELSDSPFGTTVNLVYDFATVNDKSGGLFADGAQTMMQRVQATDLKGTWTADMRERGYQPTGTAINHPEGEGFTISFELGYARADVFQEFNRATNPLGSANTSYSIVGIHPKPETPGLLAEGITRRATFGSPAARPSSTTHVLEALVEGSLLQWKQVQSDCSLNLLGSPNGVAPTFSVALADGPGGGTQVTLTYDFHAIETRDSDVKLACLPGGGEAQKVFIRSKLIQDIANHCPMAWHEQMSQRGATRVGQSSQTGTSADIRGTGQRATSWQGKYSGRAAASWPRAG